MCKWWACWRVECSQAGGHCRPLTTAKVAARTAQKHHLLLLDGPMNLSSFSVKGVTPSESAVRAKVSLIVQVQTQSAIYSPAIFSRGAWGVQWNFRQPE